jgi:hypothetical protein
MICRTKRLVLKKSSENGLKHHNNNIKILEISLTYQKSDKNIKKVCFLHKKHSRFPCSGCFFLFFIRELNCRLL